MKPIITNQLGRSALLMALFIGLSGCVSGPTGQVRSKGTVTAVNASEQTVQIKTDEGQPLTVTLAATTVLRDGDRLIKTKATLDQISMGKYLVAQCSKSPEGKLIADWAYVFNQRPASMRGASPIASAAAPTASITSSSASVIPSGNQNILGITVGPTSGVRGVRVITVASGSPCESLLKPGDTIFAFDLIGQGDLRVGGAKVNADNFQVEVSKIQPGMTVNFILNLRPLRQASCTIPANQPYTTGIGTQNAKADTFIGTVTGGNFAKGVGYSNMNVKLEVTADNSDKATFFVRSDSKVIDAGGKQIDYLEAARSKDKKVEIKYFTITDATGGDPSRSDFAYEIGQKGVRELRFLE